MSGAGSALMGIGSARGDDRSVAAAEMAISSPLLEASIDGAHGVLLSIQGGSDLGLFEINEAAQLVSNSAAPEANIIFGAVIDDALGDEVRVTVIAAGFDDVRTPTAVTQPPARGTQQPGYQAPAPQVPAQPVAPQAAPPRSGASGGSAPGTSAFSDSVTTPPSASAFAAPRATPTPAHDAANAEAADEEDERAAEPTPSVSAPAAEDSAKPATPAKDDTDTEAADEAPAETPRPATPAREPASAASGDTEADDDASSTTTGTSKPRLTSTVRTTDTFHGSTRRRPVVFEDDDELDVPDFLK
jgi:cell division protein FtsZ